MIHICGSIVVRADAWVQNNTAIHNMATLTNTVWANSSWKALEITYRLDMFRNTELSVVPVAQTIPQISAEEPEKTFSLLGRNIAFSWTSIKLFYWLYTPSNDSGSRLNSRCSNSFSRHLTLQCAFGLPQGPQTRRHLKTATQTKDLEVKNLW